LKASISKIVVEGKDKLGQTYNANCHYNSLFLKNHRTPKEKYTKIKHDEK